MTPEKCRYRKIYNLYQPNSETCDVDPGPYCGRYRIFQWKLGHTSISAGAETGSAHLIYALDYRIYTEFVLRGGYLE